MNFSISQQEMSKALALVTRVIAKKPSHPVLTNVFISLTEEGELYLRGFDMNAQITLKLGCQLKSAKPGIFGVPAHKFKEIIDRLSSDAEVNIEIVESILYLVSSTSKFQIPINLNVEEAPKMEVCTEAKDTLKVEEFLQQVQCTLFCVADAQAHIALHSLCLQFSEENISFCGANGHRFGIAVVKENTTQYRNSLLLAKPSVEHLISFLKHSTLDTFEYSVQGHLVSFFAGNAILSTRTTDAVYPPIKSLIPQSFTQTVVCDRQSLIQALNRVDIITRESEDTVQITLCSNSLLLRSTSSKDTGIAEETLPCSSKESVVSEILISNKYLTQHLGGLRSEKVCLHFNDGTLLFLSSGCEASSEAKFEIIYGIALKRTGNA